MTVTASSRRAIHYPAKTILRAERAVRCAPFRLHLFQTMVWQSVALKAIASTSGVRNQYTHKPLPELQAESELLWLIQVGVLRREVDGQGLTDSFRVTPLGRQLVDKWQNHPSPKLYAPSWSDRIYNGFLRWFRLPF